jgi:hypothetical protein
MKPVKSMPALLGANSPASSLPAGNYVNNLIWPPYEHAALMEGAVRHLQKPCTIHRRVSGLSYGVRVVGAWSDEMPESYKRSGSRQDGAHITDRAFVAAIRKGCEIKVRWGDKHAAEAWMGALLHISAFACMRISTSTQAGEQVELKAQAVPEGGKALVELYSSEDASPTHVTGRMQLVERIVMPLGSLALGGGAPVMVDLTCTLGRDEMQVRPPVVSWQALWRLLHGTCRTS